MKSHPQEMLYEEEEEYPCLTATFQCGVLSEDSFVSPIYFPTAIASYSSGQKASLTQSSPRLIT